ncbi:MAG: MFS transporter, partial [Dehalococcoidales bacterium]|nr:MFS transporter [Dehalococcoidales bacterium]
KPIEADLSWSRGTIMVAFSIFTLVAGVTAPFIGRLIDQYGARKVIIIGAIVFGSALISLRFMSSLWHLYVAHAILGIGSVALGHIAQGTVVSNWFKRRRGLAIGIMSTGVGIGGFTLSPLIGGYLIPNLGWRTSYLILGILVLATLLPLASLVIRSKPADMGLFPDGAEITPDSTPIGNVPAPKSGDMTLKLALATSTFWLIAVSFLTSSFSQSSVLQSEVNYLTDIGFPLALVATVHGMVGLGSAIGKFGFGWLCDRIAPKYSAVLGHLLIIGSIVTLLNLQPTSPPFLLWLYVACLGLGLGSWLPTMSMLVSTNFGLASYGAIIGMVSLAQGLGSSSGPLVANLIHDAWGQYRPAFIVALFLFGIGVPAILLVRRPKH